MSPRHLVKFFTNMDRRAVRASLISVALLGVVGLIFVFGKIFFGADAEALGEIFDQAASRWYALPATIIIYILLSFVGAPQFVLMAATVLAFGPVNGFIFAWVATMCSASVNFWIARLAGADVLKRFGGDWMNRASEFVGRNGLIASGLVRIVPSGPYIVVNMAFGLSPTPFWAFFVGTGLGITPKILVVGLTGQSLIAMISGQSLLLAGTLAFAVAVWLGLMLAARRRLPHPKGDDEKT
tara:strand:+ start:168 stop:887 length:720 start_codon:yes stop_codon:yes gene_type:complete